MPLYEAICPRGHRAEHIKSVKYRETCLPPYCPECGLGADWVEFSQTAPPRLVGEGFYKPSLSGPLVNKADVSKVVKNIKLGKDGNATLQRNPS